MKITTPQPSKDSSENKDLTWSISYNYIPSTKQKKCHTCFIDNKYKIVGEGGVKIYNLIFFHYN